MRDLFNLFPVPRRAEVPEFRFEEYRHEIRPILDDVFSDIGRHFDRKIGEKISAKSFRVDIKENDDSYFIEAELPGIKKEDINVKLEHCKAVTITATLTVDKTEKFVHKERTSTTNTRSFLLPIEVSEDNVKAKFENGILYVELQKSKATSGKTITIE